MAELLTVAEVAAELRMSTDFVWNELKRRNLRGSFIGREWRVDRGDLEVYVSAKANVAKVRRSA